jgi:hypothetical protein
MSVNSTVPCERVRGMYIKPHACSTSPLDRGMLSALAVFGDPGSNHWGPCSEKIPETLPLVRNGRFSLNLVMNVYTYENTLPLVRNGKFSLNLVMNV